MDRPCFVHERPWHINVPKSHFYELILEDTHPYTISKVSAKYQFCAICTTGNRAVYPWIVHVSSMFRPWFILAHYATCLSSDKTDNENRSRMTMPKEGLSSLFVRYRAPNLQSVNQVA